MARGWSYSRALLRVAANAQALGIDAVTFDTWASALRFRPSDEDDHIT
jgi:hypothetical protein